MNKRDIYLHPERLPLSFLVATVKDPDLVPHICSLRKESQKVNQSIWSAAANSPPPLLQAGRGNRGSLDKFQRSLFQALSVYGLACSPQRPIQSTWRKFFRMKSHKSVFSRYTRKERLQLTSKMPARQQSQFQTKSHFCPTAGFWHGYGSLHGRKDHCGLLLSTYICNMRQKSHNIFS